MGKMLKLIVFLGLCIVVTGCSGQSKTPDEEKILNDYVIQNPDKSYANLSKVEILRQQHNAEDKRFIADVIAVGQDEYADYEIAFSVTYNYYDDQGWMLDEVTFTGENVECYKGREIDEVDREVRNNYTSYLPGATWVDNISVTPQLVHNSEIVRLDCEIKDGYVLTRHEGLEIKFTYCQGEWVLVDRKNAPTNFYITLEKTKWTTDEYANRDIEIVSVSDDSKNIVIQCNGVNYTGTLTKSYSEDVFLDDGWPSYKLNEPIVLGSYWGRTAYGNRLDIYYLTDPDKVWFDLSDDNRSVYFNGNAGYHLASGR